jgi:hypothetical protein
MSKPLAQPSRRAVAEALVKESDPSKVVAWFCTNCGTVYKTKDDAERCAMGKRKMREVEPCTEWTCEECEQPAAPYQWYCQACLSRHRSEKEAKLLDECQKVTRAEDYPTDQGVCYDGEYYYCLEDLVETFDLEGWDLPPRVWATEPSIFSMNADDIIAAEVERWADSCDDVDIDQVAGREEFRAAVEAFNAKQGMTLWWQGGGAVDLTGWEWLETNANESDQD